MPVFFLLNVYYTGLCVAVWWLCLCVATSIWSRKQLGVFVLPRIDLFFAMATSVLCQTIIRAAANE